MRLERGRADPGQTVSGCVYSDTVGRIFKASGALATPGDRPLYGYPSSSTGDDAIGTRDRRRPS